MASESSRVHRGSTELVWLCHSSLWMRTWNIYGKCGETIWTYMELQNSESNKTNAETSSEHVVWRQWLLKNQHQKKNWNPRAQHNGLCQTYRLVVAKDPELDQRFLHYVWARPVAALSISHKAFPVVLLGDS